MLKFIHGADFHLDSAFAALPPRQAAARRRESRELPSALPTTSIRTALSWCCWQATSLTARLPTGTRRKASPPRWGKWQHRSTSPPATTTGTAPAVRT